MEIKDKNLKKKVNVYCKDCPKYECYWPREDPGSFIQGRGYQYRSDDWLCGTREANGCPSERKVNTKVLEELKSKKSILNLKITPDFFTDEELEKFALKDPVDLKRSIRIYLKELLSE